jgi:hypothetical protein
VDNKVYISECEYYAKTTLAPGEFVLRWWGSEQQKANFKRSGDHNCELKPVYGELYVVPIRWIPTGYPLTLAYGAGD